MLFLFEGKSILSSTFTNNQNCSKRMGSIFSRIFYDRDCLEKKTLLTEICKQPAIDLSTNRLFIVRVQSVGVKKEVVGSYL